MPPKKVSAPAAPGKKADQKKKEKVIEDKTFGLKNKKGAKQQKFIKQVVTQVKNPGTKVVPAADDKKGKKDDKLKEIEELNALFKPVVAAQKVSKGVDPKSVVCAFYKQGQCKKGDKCKFSHDLSLERKAEKRSMYVDARDDDLEKDDMENWDEAKLEEVINKKHGEDELQKTKTEIVCKFFLDAIESQKYGWFWSCPNGPSCMYRHALPPGFVLKKENKKDEKEEEISLEDLIEKERNALGPNVTKITLETFLEWKMKKREEKVVKFQKAMEKRKADYKAGKTLGISGREVFEFHPDLVNADDEEADETEYAPQSDEEMEDEGDVNEIDESRFVEKEVDISGISVSRKEDRFNNVLSRNAVSADQESHKLAEACGGSEDHASNGEHLEPSLDSGQIDGVPVDENLFTGDDLEDLDEELEDLDVDD
ncbi:zinc finger CCCH domain-containing protein 15 [Lampetra fluviatilis]